MVEYVSRENQGKLEKEERLEAVVKRKEQLQIFLVPMEGKVMTMTMIIIQIILLL